MEYLEQIQKLKTYYDELIADLKNTADNGDYSSHSGSFDPHTGHCDPPYTGDGLHASETIKEWEQWLADNESSAIELNNYQSPSGYPEVAQTLWEYWTEDIHGFTYGQRQQFPRIILDSLIMRFAIDVAKAIFDKDIILVEE
jgi:hypothetical protein